MNLYWKFDKPSGTTLDTKDQRYIQLAEVADTHTGTPPIWKHSYEATFYDVYFSAKTDKLK